VTLYADSSHDLSGNSKGQRVELGADRTWQWGNFYFTPRVVASWYDKNYIDYYYGVRTEEVGEGRPAYQAGSALSAEFGLLSIYRYNDHHSFMLDLEGSRLSQNVQDSPLVDDSREYRISLGYMYHFR